jgi:hypothetical protein
LSQRRGRSRSVHDRTNVCTKRHRPNDEAVGTPLCPDCYDYAGAVLHNACTPELWHAARSAGVDVPQQDDEGIPNVRAPSSVARVDFAGMARHRRQEAERHGL